MCPIHGTCRDQFADLHRLLSANLDSGADLGASLAVFVAGVPVVDSWGGYADAARTRPWVPLLGRIRRLVGVQRPGRRKTIAFVMNKRVEARSTAGASTS